MNNHKITVAVIDDGINEDLYSTGSLKYNIEITRELEIQPRIGYDTYAISHGTSCAGIIKKYSSDIELGSIKILNDDNRRSNTSQLLAALDWCADNGVKLVNMSLGTTSYKDRKALSQCVERAVDKGLIIVAACDNYNIFTYPASFGNVIGVKCDLTETLEAGEYVYADKPFDGVDIVANARHILVNFDGDSRTTRPCNSYAAPFITARVYEILREWPDMDVWGIKERLREGAVRNKTVDTYYSRLEEEYPFAADGPLIMVYDFGIGKGAELVDRLTELFMEDEYEALGVAFGRGDRGFAIRVLGDYRLESERLEAWMMERVYRIFKPDIVVAWMEMDEGLREEVERNVEMDIRLVLAPEYDVRVESVVKGAGDSEVILIGCGAGVAGNGHRVHGVDIGERMDAVEGLYGYILRLFEGDVASTEG